MNTLPTEFGSPCRLVESVELPHFLDLVYENHFGEIWLYNNDLKIIQGDKTFRELYKNRLASSLYEQVDAVKIIINDQYGDLLFGPNPDADLLDHFREIAEMPDGQERLSTFYFGKMSSVQIPDELKSVTAEGDTWIFYTHRGQLDPNPGIVMVRHTKFPFQGSDRRIAVVWSLRDQPTLQRRLKGAFENCFRTQSNFKWMKVKSVHPFEFTFEDGLSQETLRRRSQRHNQHRFHTLSVGDSVDVALVTALDDEMLAVQNVFGDGIATPLRLDKNRYVIQQRGATIQTVLLAQTADMGGVGAAVWTWDLISRWKPRYVILVGVAGGDPEELSMHLGDVVVANVVVAYERAKITQKGSRSRLRTHHAGSSLLMATTQAQKDWPKVIECARPDGTCKPAELHARIPIASGYKLVASRAEFQRLRTLHDEIHATEMEGDGVAYACEKHPEHPEWIVVKGIMDKSDSATRSSLERDKWKKYAAQAAATFARDLVLKL